MLQTLLLAAIAAAVVELLVPQGDGGRVAAYVRMIGGLFLLVVLLGPIREGLTLLREAAEGDLSEHVPEVLLPSGEPTDYEAILRDTLAAAGASEVEAWVRATLEEEFGIPPEEGRIAVLCEVTTSAEGGAEAWRVQEVRVALSGGSALRDPHPIEARIGEALGGPCYVTVDLLI